MNSIHHSVKILMSLLVGLLLVACQSAPQQDWTSFCQMKDSEWGSHGYFDATNGYSYQMANVYKERCGDQFSKAEQQLYERGFIKGVKEYCTYQKGYELGLAGETKPNVCPPELEEQFLAGFNLGKSEYAKIQNYVQVEKEETNREQELDQPPSMRECQRGC